MNKTTVLGCIAVVGSALSHAGAACAENYWVDMPGCAKEIAVGSDDRPWAIGCDAPGTIWYLGSKSVCANGLCLQRPDWKIPAGSGQADFITVRMDGQPMITDRAGELWVGIWKNVSASSMVWKRNPATQFWGWKQERTVTNSGATACLRSFSVNANYDFWAIGCGGDPEATIWRMSPTSQTTPLPGTIFVPGTAVWFQIGADEGNAAHQITQFSATSAGATTQNPWVVAVGLLFVFNGTSFDYVPTPADGSVTYATDGYIVAGGSVYRWNGSIYGVPAATPWTKIVGPTPQAPIKQIARSGKAVFGQAQIGPSRLWALDASGRIYHMAYSSTTDPR